jgi:hypothetical protein
MTSTTSPTLTTSTLLHALCPFLNARELTRSVCGIAVAVGLLLCAHPGSVAQSDRSAQGKKVSSTAAVRRSLAFEAEAAGTGYVTRAEGMALELGPDGATWRLAGAGKKGVEPTTVHMQMEGANASARLSADELQPGYSNYLLGSDPAQWRRHVAHFGRVTYTGVYAGIDLTFYGNQSHLEHDFVVSPGANPAAIGLQFAGADAADIDPEGNLQLRAGAGTLLLHRPVAYQVRTDGTRQEIAAAFLTGADRSVSFALGSYDHSRPLTIDPVLEYSTYFGGTDVDSVNDLATDSSGNLYVIGQSGSPDLPIHSQTPGACNGTCGTNNVNTGGNPLSATFKIFVLKFDPTGQTLLFSTYMGGSGTDLGMAIQPGTDGVYLAGSTSSTDFPHVHAYSTSIDPSCYGTRPAPNFATFLAKLSLDGTALTYSSNVGCGSDEFMQSYLYEYSDSYKPSGHGFLALGGNGTAYVTGFTGVDYHLTTGSTFFDAKNALFPEGRHFVAKFDTTLSGSASLLYATPIGIVPTAETQGNEVAVLDGIAANSQGDLWIYGISSSFHFPTPTANAFQPVCATSTTAYGANGECGNSFFMELAPDGQSVLYASYLGGTAIPNQGNGESAERGYTVRIGPSDEVYLFGITGSTGFPFTNTAFGTSASNYLAVFSADGSKLLSAIATNVCNTFACGAAVSSTGLAAVSGGGGIYNGIGDRFTTTNTSGTTEVYQVYDPFASGAAALLSYTDGPSSGNAGGTYAHAVTFSPTGELYVGGITTDTGMTTVNPIQTSCASCGGALPAGDAYVQKIQVVVARPTISPTSLSFTAAGSGYSSAEQYVTLTNHASFPIRYSGLGFNGQNFTQENDGTCSLSTPIPAGTSCTIGVEFTPVTAGPYSVTAPVTNTYDTVSLNLLLTGTISNGVTITPSPTALSFGPLAYNTTSAAQTVTITNSGTSSATLSGITITGTNASMFAQTNACGGTLAAGASCQASVNFTASATPPVTGTSSFTATLSIADSAGNSPQTVALTGIEAAAAPAAVVTPGSLTFPTTPLGSSSAAQAVLLNNSGTGPLSIASVGISGTNAANFTQSSNCGMSLAAGSSCTINVTFTPLSAVASSSATLTVTDNANGTAGSTQTVSLSASTVVLTASISPTTYDFGTLTTGTTATHTFNITNTSTVAIPALNAVFLLPGFSIAPGTCGTTLAVGATCTYLVTFSPTSAGAFLSTLVIQSNSYTVASTFVSGIGVLPALALAPANSNFGNVTVGGTATTVVTLSNPNSATISGLSATFFDIGTPPGMHLSSQTCGTSLAAGATCTYTITFTPTVSGSDSATLTVSGTNATAATATFNGTGTPPSFTLAPATYAFGSVALGASGTTSVTVTNTNPGAITGLSATFFDPTLPPGMSLASQTCGTTLAAGASCTYTVKFVPASTTLDTAMLTVTSSNAGSAVASFSGSGTPITFALSPANYSFGSVNVGASATTTVTLTNTNLVAITGLSMTFFDPTLPPGMSLASQTCTATLAAGASCTYTVKYSPAAAGLDTASLTVTSSNAGSSTATFSGTGIAVSVTLTPGTANFSAVVGAASTAQTFTLTNSSTATVSIASTTLVPPMGTATAFSLSASTCGTTLAAGSACTLMVVYKPTSTTGDTAMLVVADSSGTQASALTGTGLAPTDFTISITPTDATLDVYSGQIKYTVQVTSTSTTAFNGSIVLSFASYGLSPQVSYTFSPPTLVPGSSAVTSQLLVQDGGPMSNLRLPQGNRPDRSVATYAVSFGGIFLLLLFRRKARRIPTLLALAFCLLPLAMLSTGCGDPPPYYLGCPPVVVEEVNGCGVPSVTVTVTNGSISHSATGYALNPN